MKHIRIREEMQRHHWAMLPQSLQAMLAALDGFELSAEDYTKFHAQTEEHKLNSVHNFGSVVEGSLYSSIKGSTGFLDIDGPIIPRATWFSDVSGLVSLDVLTSEFKALEKNEAVKTIVFVMDTPGGVVTGISDFTALVKASTKRTETFAWMAASAGYEVASATDKITVPPTGLTGSIGTVLGLTDRSEADAKRGIKHIEIVASQSPNKRPDATTAEGQKILQTLVDELASVFVSTVAINRGVSEETVLSTFGAGAVFAGERALSVGMVDAISDLDTFVKAFGENTSSLRGFGFSAASANNQGEPDMSEPAEKKTAAELRKEQPEAVAAIEAEATTAERDRLKSIEAVAAKFDNALPSVKTEAIKNINAKKYDADATPESVALGLMDVVAKAQVDAVDEFGEGRRANAVTAGKLSSATPPETDAEATEAEASKVRVTALCDAREASQKKE